MSVTVSKDVLLLVRTLNDPSTENRWNLATVFTGKVELTAVAAVSMARFVLPFNIGKFCPWENRIGRTALNFATLEASHARKRFVCKDYSKLIINDDYTLIEFFEDRLHLAKPIWSLCGGIRHRFAH
jgi:hypothetical protein